MQAPSPTVNATASTTVDAQLSADQRQARRLLAVQRISLGESPAAVAAALGMSRAWGYQCQAQLPVPEGPPNSKRSGRPRKLSAQQERQVLRLIDAKRPDHYGFGSGLWTRQIVQQLLLARFQVRLSLLSISKLLKRLGLAVPVDVQHPNRREVNLPDLCALAKRSGAEVLFWHNTQMLADNPCVVVHGSKVASAVVATNVQGAFWFASYPGLSEPLRAAVLLGKLMRGRRRSVILVLAGCPAEWTAAACAYAATTHNRLSLHLQPSF
jgi:transposase